MRVVNGSGNSLGTGHGKLITPGSGNLGANPNAPGARKSKIVKPKVIKAGGAAVGVHTFSKKNNNIKRRAISIEHKTDE